VVAKCGEGFFRRAINAVQFRCIYTL